MVDALETMSRANGFYHDCGGVVQDSIAGFDEGDVERPRTHILWQGTSDRDPLTGNQDAGNRNRRYELFQLSAHAQARDGDHSGRGNDIYADWERALLGVDSDLGLNRNRGDGRTTTFLLSPEWQPDLERQSGGVIFTVCVIRHDNVTGTQETQ